MANLVRRAEIEKERASLTAFLSKYLSPDADDVRYPWLYCKNPEGMALAWVAYDSETHQITGVAAAFPRQICRQGVAIRGYVLGDFCIHPDFRSLGPALALQRTCLEDLSSGGPGLALDFPSPSMLAIYKRLRIETREAMIRFAKPLRTNRQIKRRIPLEGTARAISAAANAGLRLLDVGLKSESAWTIGEHTAPCGEEFTSAAQKWSSRVGVCIARSAEYMNWRFLQHPQRRSHLLTARKDGKLRGFLIYHHEGEDATIVDLLAEEEAVCRALIVETIAIARRLRVNTLSAPLLSSHTGRTTFEGCGFRPRESSPVILLNLPWSANQPNSQSADQWYITQGDRES